MISFSDWFPLFAVGVSFTFLGVAKLYGVRRGIEGGCDKRFGEKLCGTCPSWRSRYLRIGFPLFFLAIGLAELAQLACAMYSASRTQ
jgi:hypothetical protein